MAINPNTDFSVSDVLTAAQQNRFPRGVVAYTTVTATDNNITTEETQITGSSFTAIANRYYRITYFEPFLYNAVTSGTVLQRIRLTNISGTVLNLSYTSVSTLSWTGLCLAVTTLSAGTTNVVGTLSTGTGTGQAIRTATSYAFLLVEDIGLA